MEQKSLLQRVLDEMMKTEQLKNWSTIHDESGGTLLKIKFVKHVSDKRETVSDQNSDFHFYRKSDKRFNRDVTRAKQSNVSTILKSNSSATMSTILKSNSTTMNSDVRAPVASQSDDSDMISTPNSSPSNDPSDGPEENEKNDSDDGPQIAVRRGRMFVADASAKALRDGSKPRASVSKPKEQKLGWRLYPEHHRNAHMNVMKIDKDKLGLYTCELCNSSAKDLSLKGIELAYCRMCSNSNYSHKEYICADCYDSSPHASKNCYVTLIDVT